MVQFQARQFPVPAAAIDYLRSPQAIRDRAAFLFELAQQDQLRYFALDLDRLDLVVEYVAQVTRAAYPDLAVPFHSRWRHFPVARLATVFAGLTGVARTKAQIDLVIPSVLLDAGAGDRWCYTDATGQQWSRSQGLAVASLVMFEQGLFSHRGDRSTTGQGLQNMTQEQLAAALQVSASNPLVGLEGRLGLLHRLGQMIEQHIPGDRLGNLLETWRSQEITAESVLQTVLLQLGELWPRRTRLAGVNLGDVWLHPQLPPLLADTPESRLMPFHKLSQWLTYSLLEPLQELGIQVTGINQLTGLAEYRNGGLFVDFGVLRLKQSEWLAVAHAPDATLIVEWRSLTIHLLDLVADRLRQQWQMDAQTLPLVKVLQGGTWQAGRAIAAQRRVDGGPPIQLKSDGTVF